MKKVILKIDGMSCSACQNRVEKYLNKQDGVNASVNLVMQQALIEYDETKVCLSDLDRFVSESGYKSLGVYNEKEESKKDNTITYLIIFGFLILLIMYISMSHMIGLKGIPFLDMHKYPVNYAISLLILTIPFVLFGFNIIKSGISKLLHFSPNMDSLVSIGIISSLIYSTINLTLIINGRYELASHLYFESSAMIIYFVKLGRYIDKNSKERTKEAIKELVQITPDSALIKTTDGFREVTIDEVNKGDILICKPGMKVAVDGVIVSGESHFNESFITGESISYKKKIDDQVVAGAINLDGYIEYKALHVGPESTISNIVRLVTEATNTKAPISTLADKISGYFVPGIILIAIITLLTYLVLGHSFNESIISFVTVLLVACPCALGLATPLAMVVSVGNSARKGILIKSSEVLENARNIDTIIFDKTGTLTYGNLKISKIYNYSEYSEKEILSNIASIENYSSHPIANSFKEYYNKDIIANNFSNINGIGVCAEINKDKYYIGNNKLIKKIHLLDKHRSDELELSEKGNSIVYVIKNKKVIALIGVKDVVRDNSKQVIHKLLTLKKDIIMLSGDNEKTATNIANEIGIKKVIANVLPNEKENIIKKLKKDGHKVMMVGDGINDAPSLVSSDIGVSIENASDIASSSADIILINNDLSKIIDIFNISNKTIRIIKQNLFWAFIYNIFMIPLAIGLLKPFNLSLSPMLASLFMTISSLTVVLNSLRLKNK